MPLWEQAGLLFVAIPKTGSTSMVSALGSRTDTLGDMTLRLEVIDDDFRQRHNIVHLGDRHIKRAKHLSALQLRRILGPERFNASKKFAVVRNPWS